MTPNVKWEVETRLDSHRVYAGIYSTFPGVESPPGEYPLLIARFQDVRDAEWVMRTIAALSSAPERPAPDPDLFAASMRDTTLRIAFLAEHRRDALEEAAKLVRDAAGAGEHPTVRTMAAIFSELAARIRALAGSRSGGADHA